MSVSLFGELDLEDVNEVPFDGAHEAVVVEAVKYESKAGNTSIKVVVKFTDEEDEFVGEKFIKYISYDANLATYEKGSEKHIKAMADLRKWYLPALRALNVPEEELLAPDLEAITGLRVLVNGAGRDRRDGQGKEWTIYSIKADN